MNTNNLPAIGSRVKMTSFNSNWNVGELGTITGHFDGGTGTIDRVAVAFDGREDDYTAFADDFVAL